MLLRIPVPLFLFVYVRHYIFNIMACNKEYLSILIRHHMDNLLTFICTQYSSFVDKTGRRRRDQRRVAARREVGGLSQSDARFSSCIIHADRAGDVFCDRTAVVPSRTRVAAHETTPGSTSSPRSHILCEPTFS